MAVMGWNAGSQKKKIIYCKQRRQRERREQIWDSIGAEGD